MSVCLSAIGARIEFRHDDGHSVFVDVRSEQAAREIARADEMHKVLQEIVNWADIMGLDPAEIARGRALLEELGGVIPDTAR